MPEEPVANEQTVAPAQPVLNDSYDLDLDLIQPQIKKVRLNGQIYDVHPPKIKDIANLTRLAGQLSEANDANVQDKVDEMVATFARIMPGLKDTDVDLSVEQLTALFQFVNTMINPAENSALKSMGIEPTTEKKIQVG